MSLSPGVSQLPATTATDGQAVYVFDGQRILTIDGSGTVRTVLPGMTDIPPVGDIAFDSTNLYWTTRPGNFGEPGAVWSLPLACGGCSP